MKSKAKEEDKVICKCGNDTFKVYIKVIIDDAELVCAKCGNVWGY